MKVSATIGRVVVGMGLLALLAAALPGESPSGPFKVQVADGKVVIGEAILPIDPTPRIAIGQSGSFAFGLTVSGNRICCSPNGSIWSALRIDGQIHHMNFGQPVLAKPGLNALPPGPFDKKRLGFQTDAQYGKIHLTQVVEIVPSKSSARAASVGQKRPLDTCRISYIVHNQDTQPHNIDFRASIDMLIANNDGALYAAPTTHPGQVLNGMVLEGKKLPGYLQALERPSLTDPGFVATMTLKQTRGAGPNKVVLSNLGAVAGFGQQMWDIAAQPAGDSACALYWNGHTLKAGEKRELVWAYGGGLASDPDNEGKVLLGLGGSFEPHKLFTLTATVEDPVPNQALTLELPAGLELVEGPAIQPVPLPGPDGNSAVLWKGRVRLVGDHEIKVHSSTGTLLTKRVRIEPYPIP